MAAAAPPACRCVVADDHPALVTVLESYLGGQGYDVVETASDGRRAVDLATVVDPDVFVVDWRMPYLEGVPLLRALREASPEASVVVYTADADLELWDEASAAGAAALVLKEAPLADLCRAIESVRAGRGYLDPALAPFAVDGQRPSVPTLTAREADVLTLLAEGLSHDEIGERLAISSETVRTHVRKACARLGAATRTQAVATALRLGLIA